MAKKLLRSVPIIVSQRPVAAVKIDLTPVQNESGQEVPSFSVFVAELIAYSQNCNRTQVKLTKGRVIEVLESTEQIDRLIRAAASQNHSGVNPPTSTSY
ncbi:MAG TPA: hypothetical protein VG347_08505 [Verrucomicrobiae bacterium]|nr:hypothetical protein [Verrucomicrobiae bacterium]